MTLMTVLYFMTLVTIRFNTVIHGGFSINLRILLILLRTVETPEGERASNSVNNGVND